MSSFRPILPAPGTSSPSVSSSQQYTPAHPVTLISSVIPANGSASWTSPQGSGAIDTLSLSAGSGIASTSGLTIQITFDNASTPYVNAKVGGFFGAGTSLNAGTLANAGTTWMQSVGSDGSLSSLWVMPYSSSAKVVLRNTTNSPISVTLTGDIIPWTWSSQTSMYFHAYERIAGPILTSTNQTAKFLDVIGAGLYVGDSETSTSAQGPQDNCYNWWGEGDELFYVDGTIAPNYRGTGTEDYFGYAYGHPKFFQSPWVSQTSSAPQVGRTPNSFDYDGVTVLNRQRLLDGITFTKRLRFDFEIDDHDQTAPCSGNGTAGPQPSELTIDHTAFFYALPGAIIQEDTISSGAIYTIQSKIAGWNLTANDAGALTEDVFANDETQRFQLTNTTGSTYTIKNVATGLYVGSSGSTAGNPLSLAPYSGTCNQLWTLQQPTAIPVSWGAPTTNNAYVVPVNGCAGGLAMDVVNGDRSAEGIVQQYTFTSSDSQQWRFTPSPSVAAPILGNGIYNLANASSGLLLDVPNASTSVGQAMQIYQGDQSSSQAWSINPLGGGFYSIRGEHGGLALDDGGNGNDDAPVSQSQWANSPGERWRILPFGNNNGFEVLNTDNQEQYLLGVGYNSVSNGGPVQQQQPGEGTQHVWYFQPVQTGSTTITNGTYVIVGSANAEALDVTNASKASGTQLQIYPLDGTSAQQWFVKQLPNGTFNFLNANSLMALDNEGATSPNGSLDQYSWSDGANQWWNLNAVSPYIYTIRNAANNFLMAPVNIGSVQNPNCMGTPLQQQQAIGGPASVAPGCLTWSLVAAGPPALSPATPAVPPGTSTSGLPQQTAPPLPCGTEGQTCAFSGPAIVSYGTGYGQPNANRVFLSQTAINNFPCTYEAFGSDPDQGQPKTCWYTPLPSGVPNGVYNLSGQASHLVLDVVNGSLLNGGLVQQYTDNGSATQHWQIQNQGFGYYSIIDMGSGRALDSYGVGGENGQLHQYLWLDTPSQLWQILPNIDGSYTFISQATPGFTLQVAGNSTQAGAQVQQLSAAGGTAQNWYLQPLSSPSAPAPVPIGIYSLINRNSELALDVTNGSHAAHTIMQQYIPSELSNQQWAVAQLANGNYTLRNVNTGLMLDNGGVTMSNLGAPARDEAATYPYPNSQQWTFARNTDGSFTITNVGDSLILGISNASLNAGTPTSMYTSTNAPDQGWKLQTAPVRLPTGTYTIKNANSGLLLDVTNGGVGNGVPIQQYTPDVGSGATAQQWTVTYVSNSDDIYVITNVNSGLALDNASATLPGAQVDQYTYSNNDNMHWQIFANNDGTFTVRNVANQFALNVSGDSVAPGAAVVQQVAGASGSESWSFQILQ